MYQKLMIFISSALVASTCNAGGNVKWHDLGVELVGQMKNLMTGFLISCVIASALTVAFIVIAWGFSPSLEAIQRNHAAKFLAMSARTDSLSKANLATENLAYSLILKRGRLLALSVAIFMLSAFTLLVY